MVKYGPKFAFLNLGESKDPQNVQKGATFPFFKTMNLKVHSKLVLNFLMIKSALYVFCSLLIKYG